MQILMGKINFIINSPFLPVALIILSLLICYIYLCSITGSIVLIKKYSKGELTTEFSILDDRPIQGNRIVLEDNGERHHIEV